MKPVMLVLLAISGVFLTFGITEVAYAQESGGSSADGSKFIGAGSN